jgi:hypothetical protein
MIYNIKILNDKTGKKFPKDKGLVIPNAKLETDGNFLIIIESSKKIPNGYDTLWQPSIYFSETCVHIIGFGPGHTEPNAFARRIEWQLGAVDVTQTSMAM